MGIFYCLWCHKNTGGKHLSVSEFVWIRVSAAPLHINTISFGLLVMLSLSAHTKGQVC